MERTVVNAGVLLRVKYYYIKNIIRFANFRIKYDKSDIFQYVLVTGYLFSGILETYWDKHSVIASTPPPSPTSGESSE